MTEFLYYNLITQVAASDGWEKRRKFKCDLWHNIEHGMFKHYLLSFVGARVCEKVNIEWLEHTVCWCSCWKG